jgi:thiol-disulfide isomerase/thioredoxin
LGETGSTRGAAPWSLEKILNILPICVVLSSVTNNNDMKKYYTFAAIVLAPLFLHAKEKDAAAVPDVSLEKVSYGTVVNDAEFDAKALEGKVVVIEAWGVKCPPCIASLPEMQRLARSGEKKGLVVLGFESQNSSKEAILDVLKDARVKYPVMSGANLPVPFNGIPHVAVFGADGKLTWHGHPSDGDFKRAVKDALKALAK